MKAIILSAGQGSRLLPLTEGRPKSLLPLGPRLCSVTWVETRAVADQLLAGDAATLLLELQDRIGPDLEAAELCGRPAGHPLSGIQAARYAAPREFDGTSFPDAGWPAIPALGQFPALGEAQFDKLIQALRQALA